MKKFVKSLSIVVLLMSLVPTIIKAGNCGKTVMENVSKEDWVDYDYEVLEIAKKRCNELYPGNSCIVLFRKYQPKQYSVICGEEGAETATYTQFLF